MENIYVSTKMCAKGDTTLIEFCYVLGTGKNNNRVKPSHTCGTNDIQTKSVY